MSSQTQQAWLPARAKLNLVLRITGRRADGYHLLETLFHTLELHDDVVVRRLPGRGVTIGVTAARPDLAAPADEQNLAVRALCALQSRCSDTSRLHVQLHKRIPSGGGLGGGSSDAAAALRLGNHLLGDPLGIDELAELGVALGADVPFFLRGGSQWGTGIGDRLEPAEVPPRAFVLLLPPYGCETAAVYKNHAARWQATDTPDSISRITVPENREGAPVPAEVNDLEPAAERLRPELGRLRRRVAELGYRQVRMTGSGSTLFVALPGVDRTARDRQAEHCVEELSRGLADGEHAATRLLSTCSGPPIDAEAISREVPAELLRQLPEPGPPDTGF